MKYDRIIEINEEKSKFEHTPERKDTRAGGYGRKLQTKPGEHNFFRFK